MPYQYKTYGTVGDILIVDDTLPSLRALIALLKDSGYEERGATSGAATSTEAKQMPFPTMKSDGLSI